MGGPPAAELRVRHDRVNDEAVSPRHRRTITTLRTPQKTTMRVHNVADVYRDITLWSWGCVRTGDDQTGAERFAGEPFSPPQGHFRK